MEETKVQSPFKPTVVSGMRVTGSLHLGHYFGTLRNWLELQDQYPCYFGLMDWHGMTTAYKNTKDLPGWALQMFSEWLAWGIDLDKATVFYQSWVPEHLHLFMAFANATPMGWLERVPTWKDAEEEAKQNDTHNLGRFAYPVLQAADVAIYRGSLVPVGQDQVAHLELTREIIRRFNRIYKTKLPEPKPLLTDTPLVPGLDGKKMSKSLGNTLEVSQKPAELRKKVMTMPTDPQRVRREDAGEPTRCTVFAYHKLFSSAEDIAWVEKGCRSAGIGCGDCKGRLVENIESKIASVREKKLDLDSRPEWLKEQLVESTKKAARVAAASWQNLTASMGEF